MSTILYDANTEIVHAPLSFRIAKFRSLGAPYFIFSLWYVICKFPLELGSFLQPLNQGTLRIPASRISNKQLANYVNSWTGRHLVATMWMHYKTVFNPCGEIHLINLQVDVESNDNDQFYVKGRLPGFDASFRLFRPIDEGTFFYFCETIEVNLITGFTSTRFQPISLHFIHNIILNLQEFKGECQPFGNHEFRW